MKTHYFYYFRRAAEGLIPVIVQTCTLGQGPDDAHASMAFALVRATLAEQGLHPEIVPLVVVDSPTVSVVIARGDVVGCYASAGGETLSPVLVYDLDSYPDENAAAQLLRQKLDSEGCRATPFMKAPIDQPTT